MSGGHYGTHSAVQLLYVVMVVVWSLSYTPECASKLGHAAGLVPKLVDILKSVQKEKASAYPPPPPSSLPASLSPLRPTVTPL